MGLLTGNVDGRLTDDAVHEIRTRAKQLRTLLRLARSATSKTRYQRSKRCLQQVSHRLAAIRDATVVSSAAEKLARGWEPAHRAHLRATLEGRLERAHLKATAKMRRSIAKQLATVRGLIDSCPESHSGWKSISPGLRHVYASGRNAFETPASAHTDTSRHELRKRAKDLQYASALLRKVSPHAKSLLSDLDRFTHLLGADHDLTILRQAATAGHLTRKKSLREHLLKSAIREQTQLRKRAWSIGSRIYADSPAAFVKRIHKDWVSRLLVRA